MISLDEFDFNSTCHASWLDYKELPIEHIALLDSLEQASAENNISAVKETFTSLREAHASPDILVGYNTVF